MGYELCLDKETIERLWRLSKTFKVSEADLLHNLLEHYEETLKALEINILYGDGGEDGVGIR